MKISEPDWKTFKRLRSVALERFSQRVLDECQEVCAKGVSAHERYGELYELIQERNREMARTFDGFSRSSALICLGLIREYNLLAEEVVAEFREETRRATNVGK